MPRLFPNDEVVWEVAEAMCDPFEYFILPHKDGLLRTDFAQPLGRVSYHIPCHGRVQSVGQKTRDTLRLIPGIEVNTIERCAGRDGTWGVKKEYFEVPHQNRLAGLLADGPGRPRLHQLRLPHRWPAHPAGYGRRGRKGLSAELAAQGLRNLTGYPPCPTLPARA